MNTTRETRRTRMRRVPGTAVSATEKASPLTPLDLRRISRDSYVGYCPLPEHNDRESGQQRRSLMIDVSSDGKLLYHCHSCGSVYDRLSSILGVTNQEISWQWALPSNVPRLERRGATCSAKPGDLSESRAIGWHRAFLHAPAEFAVFEKHRGIGLKTVKRYQLGYDRATCRYTIPIRDASGVLVNVKNWSPDATPKYNAIAGTKAMLYPIDELNKKWIVICEGEYDSLVARQALDALGKSEIGVLASTAGAGSKAIWEDNAPLFKGKHVVVLYDCDDAGRRGARDVARILRPCAKTVRVADLGVEGADVTDVLVHGGWSHRKLWKRLCAGEVVR